MVVSHSLQKIIYSTNLLIFKTFDLFQIVTRALEKFIKTNDAIFISNQKGWETRDWMISK